MTSKFKFAQASLPIKSAAIVAAVAVSLGVANATCWLDSNLTAIAQSIAQSGFPNAASRMPTVLVCDGAHFGPNVGGDYTGGVHQIRLPHWQLNRAELRSVLAHELAHAETWLTGGSDANNGHSADFMRALLRAGWHSEAQRVADHVNGARYALDEAKNSLYGQAHAEASPDDGYRPPRANPPITYTPPIRMQRVCHDEQQAVYRQIGPGRYHLSFVTHRICRWWPVQ